MLSDKQIKKEFLKEASEEPDKYYATKILIKEGFKRKNCAVCKRFFWTVNKDQITCGDSACQGKISIFTDNPSTRKLSFVQVWNSFKQHMQQRGYTPIRRYPVVARWNPTTDFTMASIAAFQPYVISGEVEPVAKKIVIPQFCLRFNDIDNVGVTGSHCTGFVMIGQHQFVTEEEWDQNKAFEDLLTYLTQVIGLTKKEITLHEDAWAGGGNFGPCMEFFSRGVELCNQVYMMYEQAGDKRRELNIKVLDMGLGMERVAWFTQATPTVYDAAFPQVINKLKKATGVVFDKELYAKFAPYSTLLNLDEVDDIAKAWLSVAKKIGCSSDELREKIEPMRALYSIAEHSRALLVAISDGALPGNTGGNYNLRAIFRRAQDFINEYKWGVDIKEVASWHAQELKELYPELEETLSDTNKVLDIELKKYSENRAKAKKIILSKLRGKVTVNDLLVLYDSHGITPKQVKQVAKEKGIKISIPDNFYKLVEELHDKKQGSKQAKKEEYIDFSRIKETEPLFYKSYDLAEEKAIVLGIDENKVVLDRTIFYPTSGGQQHDIGYINDYRVINVIKQGPHIIHVLEKKPSLNKGDKVELKIDIDRRIQLSQHHTGAHIINGAARMVLGNHVWQAGASKTPEKGRIDITHYESIKPEELRRIEALANEIIRRDLPVNKIKMKKAIAEQEFGFRLYQGGAVPGNIIRVIEIPGFDTEACGGTHVNTTGELQIIKILKSTKIQDGVVRIEYVAGRAAHKLIEQENRLSQEVMELLGIKQKKLIPARVEELFSKWKKAKKLRKKKKEVDKKLLTLSSEKITVTNDPLLTASDILSVQVEHLPRTIRRFKKDLEEWSRN